MRINYRTTGLPIAIALILTGCAINNPRFFSAIEPTADLSYGYTAENPVLIKNFDLKNSIGSSYYYITRLRTEEGDKLQMVQKFSVANPNYKEPAIPIRNIYTSQPLSYGNGPLLDLYILVSEHKVDTFEIFIIPYVKGEIKIPYGLQFEKE